MKNNERKQLKLTISVVENRNFSAQLGTIKAAAACTCTSTCTCTCCT